MSNINNYNCDNKIRCYDEHRAIIYISQKTGFDKNIVRKILEARLEYSIGLDLIEEIPENNGLILREKYPECFPKENVENRINDCNLEIEFCEKLTKIPYHIIFLVVNHDNDFIDQI